ncbi:unnamed protein product [Blepharisma stoltei]|uniref:Uncharacterized protein n=1 Tax=Blepharisma stoltei TaxID=1481888 RepID=A0AAU9JMU6_9CILI|nr:unnamed protein product [Blepharisma stoltei]
MSEDSKSNVTEDEIEDFDLANTFHSSSFVAPQLSRGSTPRTSYERQRSLGGSLPIPIDSSDLGTIKCVSINDVDELSCRNNEFLIFQGETSDPSDNIDVQIDAESQVRTSISEKTTEELTDENEKLKSLVKDFYLKSQHMEEALKEKDSEIEKLKIDYENEIETLKSSISMMEEKLSLKKKEYSKSTTKLDEENEELENRVASLVEKIKSLEKENAQLNKEISAYQKTIQNLEAEMTNVCEDSYSSANEKIQDLERQCNSLQNQLKMSKQALSEKSEEKEKINEKLMQAKEELSKKSEISDKEKRTLTELVLSYKEEIEEMKHKLEKQESSATKSKEDLQNELQNRVHKLIQEKSELENEIRELRDNIDINRLSTNQDSSLQDELGQLSDRSSKGNTPRFFHFDYKKDLEKDALINALKEENLSMKKEFETLGRKTQKIKLLEEENLKLQNRLKETECVAIQASINYAEAATDRDNYKMMYLELKNGKKGWFRR